MSDLPAPLVPAECSMSGNDWFPFYFDRLRKSKWWRRASDVARSRNVMMWGEAFKASPAGSLPDDDDELAEAAGYGMDIDTFLAVKPEIMAPWVLCSDGRWYHPTVCEVVLDAWDRASERRKSAAERQRRRRERVRDHHPARPNVTPAGAVVTLPIDPVTRDIAESERDFGIQTVQTGQDIEEADASLSPSSDERRPDPKYPEAFEVCWKAYPHVRGRSSKPKAHGAWRRIPAATRQDLPAAIARYAREGREPNEECGAPAMERWLRDGRFEDWLADVPGKALPQWPGPPDVWSAVVAAKGDEFALGYLARTAWRDVPQRAVTSPNGFVIDTLRKEVGPVLAALDVRISQEKAA